MLAITLLKIQDLERAVDVFARSCRAENIVFKPEGMEITMSDPMRKSVLHLQCRADFFESYKCKETFEAGFALSEVVETLHATYQVHHVKVLEVQDTASGQLHFSGFNPNGKRQSKFLSPHSVDTPYELDSTLIDAATYPFLISLPSNWFQLELMKHQSVRYIRLVFDVNGEKKKSELRVESDKQHGLNSQSKAGFILEPENVVLLDPKKKVESQEAKIDTKYLRIMARANKIVEDIRIYLCTGQPVIFEYLLKQSNKSRSENSFLQLRIGTVASAPHPYVDHL